MKNEKKTIYAISGQRFELTTPVTLQEILGVAKYDSDVVDRDSKKLVTHVYMCAVKRPVYAEEVPGDSQGKFDYQMAIEYRCQAYVHETQYKETILGWSVGTAGAVNKAISSFKWNLRKLMKRAKPSGRISKIEEGYVHTMAPTPLAKVPDYRPQNEAAAIARLVAGL